MKYIPLKLTQPVEDGDAPPDLGWKDLGPLRILNVRRDSTGNVAMELGYHNTHVKLVCTKSGINVYRNDTELVECTA